MSEPVETTESECSGRSRRRFVVGAMKTGVVAGTALWAAPKLTSVALAQETAGSPPPATSTSAPPEVERETDVLAEREVRGARESGGPAHGPAEEGQGDQGLGVLALTGGDVRKLAVAGGAAVLTGEALLLMRRYFPPPQLALTAGAPDGAVNGHVVDGSIRD